jgi:hypothetical protein
MYPVLILLWCNWWVWSTTRSFSWYSLVLVQNCIKFHACCITAMWHFHWLMFVGNLHAQMPGVTLHVSMGMFLQLFQHISLWMMTGNIACTLMHQFQLNCTGTKESEHVAVFCVCVFCDYSITTEPYSAVPWVHVTMCFIIREVYYSMWWQHISQQLNTSAYTVYNIYGFPYFFKSGITSWGA